MSVYSKDLNVSADHPQHNKKRSTLLNCPVLHLIVSSPVTTLKRNPNLIYLTSYLLLQQWDWIEVLGGNRNYRAIAQQWPLVGQHNKRNTWMGTVVFQVLQQNSSRFLSSHLKGKNVCCYLTLPWLCPNGNIIQNSASQFSGISSMLEINDEESPC